MEAPERIYLQDAGDYAGAAEFEVTWCCEPQDPADTAYIRADIYEAQAAQIAALSRTYDELYADAIADAKSDAQDFDGDLWKVVRDYLTSLDFDWSNYVEDGVTAACAIEFIRECMDDETRRADRAEAQIAELTARAEAAEAARDNLSDKLELERALCDGAFRRVKEAEKEAHECGAERHAWKARAEAAEETAAQHDKLRAAALGTLKRVSAHLETATEALEEIAEHDSGSSAGLAFTAKTALAEIGGCDG